MNNVTRERLFWCMWIALIGAAFALRFTVFSDVGEQRRAGLGFGYFWASWLFAGVQNLFVLPHFTSYMESHHRQKWAQVAHVSFLGQVLYNGFGVLGWLYSKDDFGDPVVASLRAERRALWHFQLTVRLSAAIISLMLAL